MVHSAIAVFCRCSAVEQRADEHVPERHMIRSCRKVSLFSEKRRGASLGGGEHAARYLTGGGCATGDLSITTNVGIATSNVEFQYQRLYARV